MTVKFLFFPNLKKEGGVIFTALNSNKTKFVYSIIAKNKYGTRCVCMRDEHFSKFNMSINFKKWTFKLKTCGKI